VRADPRRLQREASTSLVRISGVHIKDNPMLRPAMEAALGQHLNNGGIDSAEAVMPVPSHWFKDPIIERRLRELGLKPEDALTSY
jgi:hypothetical protein